MQLSGRNLSKVERTISNKVAKELTDIKRSSKLGVTESRWFR